MTDKNAPTPETPADATPKAPVELSGNQKRKMKSASRLYTVQALFQMEASGQTVEKVIAEFEDHRFGATYDGDEMIEGDITLFRRLMQDAVNYQAPIDQMTDRALVAKWPIARIDPTLRALFRAAGAELTQSDTPPKVIITEFVDVARAFFPEGQESRFVNAVLDHMAREAQPDAF
jgi:N utilization substance protein B